MLARLSTISGIVVALLAVGIPAPAAPPAPPSSCVAAVSTVDSFAQGKQRIADELRRGSFVPGCRTAAELIEADDILFGRSWDPYAGKASYAYSLRAGDSRFHVSVDAAYPDEAVALQKMLGDRAVVTLGGVGRAGRLDDGEPHYGGSGIQQNAGTTSTNICTAGFTVRRNADGGRGAVTAGHCFGNGVYVYSGPQYFGYTWGKYNFPAYDIIGIRSGTETYTNVIHVDPCCPTTRTVVGYDPADIGDLVCLTGMVTRAICGVQVTSTNGYFCDQYGCTGGLIEGIKNNTVIVRPGDSGAPIYTRYGSNSALATGMVIAMAGSGTIVYGEHISVIEAYLNVSVLTS
jgi:hypothetical protein